MVELPDPGVLTSTSTVIDVVEVKPGEETVLEESFLNYRLGSVTIYKYLDSGGYGDYDPDSDSEWNGSEIPIPVELRKADGTLVEPGIIGTSAGSYTFEDVITR